MVSELIDLAFEKGLRVFVHSESGDGWTMHKRPHTVKRWIGKRSISIQLSEEEGYLPTSEHVLFHKNDGVFSYIGKPSDKEWVENVSLERVKELIERNDSTVEVIGKCAKCGSERQMFVSAECSDLCQAIDLQRDVEYEPYVAFGLNLGGGDYLEFYFCMDCGHIRGEWPIDDDKIQRG